MAIASNCNQRKMAVPAVSRFLSLPFHAVSAALTRATGGQGLGTDRLPVPLPVRATDQDAGHGGGSGPGTPQGQELVPGSASQLRHRRTFLHRGSASTRPPPASGWMLRVLTPVGERGYLGGGLQQCHFCVEGSRRQARKKADPVDANEAQGACSGRSLYVATRTAVHRQDRWH